MSKRRIMVQAPNGMQVWIPEDKLEAWEKARNAPMTEERKKVVEEIYQMLRGNRK